MPKPALLPWTIAVLAAHAWLLWQWPLGPTVPADEAPAPAPPPAFATRSIAPQPQPQPQPKPKPPRVAAPAPAPAPPPALPPAPAIDEALTTLTTPPEPASEPALEGASEEVPEEALEEAPAPEPPLASEPSATPPAQDAAPLPETLQGVQWALPGAPARFLQADPPVRLPAPAQLSFDVFGQAKGFDYRASAQLRWQHDGMHYQLHQEIKAFLLGRRSQTSSGRIADAGLVPEHFNDRGRQERSADLDFGARQATFSAQSPPAPIGPGAQDRLSVFLQLSSLLAAAPQPYPPGTEITFTTVGHSSAERWTFRVHGSQTLELPMGTLEAFRLERLPRHAKDQQATLWLAPSLDYLPVRIRLTQANADFADLRLRAYSSP